MRTVYHPEQVARHSFRNMPTQTYCSSKMLCSVIYDEYV